MVHHAVVERLRHFGQQRQPVAVGQHEQELADLRIERTGSGDQLLHDGALARSGYGRIGQHALKRLIAGNEPREIAEVALRPQKILAFSERDVEECPRVPGGGAATGHRASLSRGPFAPAADP